MKASRNLKLKAQFLNKYIKDIAKMYLIEVVNNGKTGYVNVLANGDYSSAGFSFTETGVLDESEFQQIRNKDIKKLAPNQFKIFYSVLWYDGCTRSRLCDIVEIP